MLALVLALPLAAAVLLSPRRMRRRLTSTKRPNFLGALMTFEVNASSGDLPSANKTRDEGTCWCWFMFAACVHCLRDLARGMRWCVPGAKSESHRLSDLQNFPLKDNTQS